LIVQWKFKYYPCFKGTGKGEGEGKGKGVPVL